MRPRRPFSLRPALAGAALFALAAPGWAQDPRKIFQLTSVRVGRRSVEIDWYSMPGSALAAATFDRIDTDRDGKVSVAEGQAYARRTLRDVTLVVDGKPRPLLVRHVTIVERKQMLTGLGSIDFLVYAEIPERLGRHTLSFENRHRRAVSTFKTGLLNDLGDPSLRILSPRQSAAGARLSLTYVVGKQPRFP